MPRRSRITVAEVPVHIIQRGNNRGACFFADTDYELDLANLHALAAKFACVGWVSDRLCSKSKGGRVTHRCAQDIDTEHRDGSGGLRFSRHSDG